MQVLQEQKPVLAALAIANVYPVLLGINVADFKVKGFTQAQTHAISGEDIDLVAQLAGGVDQ